MTVYVMLNVVHIWMACMKGVASMHQHIFIVRINHIVLRISIYKKISTYIDIKIMTVFLWFW